IKELFEKHEQLITRKNKPAKEHNGIYQKYQFPVLTAAHAPVFWRYELDPKTNPFLMERIGVNAAFNAGAISYNGKFQLAVRVDSHNRKSFFAIAESENGIDNFRFGDPPMQLPDSDEPDINVYDLRLTQHEDGGIYGLFCTERKEPHAAPGDFSS